MPAKLASKDLYAMRGRSLSQRAALTAALGLWLALVWWLVEGGGVQSASVWVGRSWQPGDQGRRVWLGLMFSIYFVRLLFTQFVFLQRAISWGEAALIAVWVFCLALVLPLAGGTNAALLGAAGYAGAFLFVLGSWMNSSAEYARHAWKKKAENRGRLYTDGWFRYSRHPNYLGDVISFSGICLVTGRWWTGVLPLLMLAGFVFANIPMLDAHLHDHYGESWDAYAARTRKLIPFVY